MDRPRSSLSDLHSAKRKCRARLRARLAAMTAAERHVQSEAICDRVRGLDGFRAAAVVLLYRPLPTEVDVMPLWAASRVAGRRVYFPRLAGADRPLQFVQVHDDTEWRKSALGFLEPRSNHSLTDEEAARAAIIVPGVGFTRRGDRLGRGAGCYDRTLPVAPISGLGYRIGVAFEPQLLDELPVNALDVGVHAVITPANVWLAALPLPRAT